MGDFWNLLMGRDPVSSTAAKAWVCPKCGVANEAGNKYCSECGTKRPEKSENAEKPTAKTWACPRCGVVNPTDNKCCSECGTKRPEKSENAEKPTGVLTGEERLRALRAAMEQGVLSEGSVSGVVNAVHGVVDATVKAEQELEGAEHKTDLFLKIFGVLGTT